MQHSLTAHGSSDSLYMAQKIGKCFLQASFNHLNIVCRIQGPFHHSAKNQSRVYTVSAFAKVHAKGRQRFMVCRQTEARTQLLTALCSSYTDLLIFPLFVRNRQYN